MSQRKIPFTKKLIRIDDVNSFCQQIVSTLSKNVKEVLIRRGGVVGISGGIDSAVPLAISVRAFGPDNVLGIMLPERDSDPKNIVLAQQLANKYGVKVLKEDITKVLIGFGCYKRRDEAVKNVFPKYDSSIHKFKINIRQDYLQSNMPPVFSIIIVALLIIE